MSEDILETLQRIGIRAPRDALDALLIHATKSRFSPVQLLEELVAIERRERDHRNLARRIKEATLGSFTPLDQVDWNHPRAIERGLYEHLLSGEFIAKGANVLFRGPSGVGKAMLAQNLAMRGVEKGYAVRFCTLGAALADLLQQESLPGVERRLKRYVSPDLLVLDEIGYLPCDSRSADLFYNIISRRHEKKSTVITTNLAFKQWNTIFPGAACVVALVDRFAQHCHVVDINADSWRLTHPHSAPDGTTVKRNTRRP